MKNYYFRERTERAPIKHFSRMFVAIRQGGGLSIVNDTLFLTHATREQSDVSVELTYSFYSRILFLQFDRIFSFSENKMLIRHGR